jgi:hypothetical protein
MTSSSKKEVAWLVGATLVVLAPFVGKPLNVDDALFYWAAKRIAVAPLDPYGFDVNWYVTSMPMSEVTKNPPGASYLLALAGLLFGWSPTGLHLVFLVPALGVVVGTWALARRLSSRPLLAGLLVLAAPGFVTSATSVMSDVPALALAIAALVLWVDGIERDRPGLLLAAVALATTGVLTKYLGAYVVALFAIHGVMRRGLGRWMVPLVVVPAAILAYEAWSAGRYGAGFLGQAVSYAREEGTGARLTNAVAVLAFFGGATAFTLPVALVLSPRSLGVVAVLGGLAAGVALFVSPGSWWDSGRFATDVATIAVHFAVFVAAGIAAVGLAGIDAWRRRDANAAVLLAWVLGILVFAAFVNWTANVRSVLPAVPAAAILVARAADDRLGTAPLPLVPRVAIALCIALGFWVAWGDAELARAQVRAADVVRGRATDRRGDLWFMGHWGFQVAMESLGARPVEANATIFHAGDWIVVPGNNTNVVPLPPEMPARRESFEVALRGGGTTIATRRGAGFYSSTWGPLPYRIEPPAPERFVIVEVADATN